MAPKGFTKVGSKSKLPAGEMILAEVHGERVLVCNVDGQICAVAETCPHAGAPLSEGYLTDDTVECPWHSSVFNVKTGDYVEGPASEGLTVYEVAVDGDEIFVGPEKP
jgi:nitrite reductase/ring-hydroxylating ferredoxin subunit